MSDRVLWAHGDPGTEVLNFQKQSAGWLGERRTKVLSERFPEAQEDRSGREAKGGSDTE